MAETKIEWTATPRPDGTMAPGYTFNPWMGCTKVSAGCTHCYAETMSRRNPAVFGEWGDKGTRVVTSETYWRQPLQWNRKAAAAGERRRVFCASLADFAEERPELVEPRQRLFKLIGATPNLDWLLLTKRPQTCVEHWPLWCGYADATRQILGTAGTTQPWPVIPNVWLGVSVEDQARADERIPLLLQVPARVRFLSVEPLLGPVDLSEFGPRCPDEYESATGHWDTCSIPDHCAGCGGTLAEHSRTLDWAIIGGESGHAARPCHVEWIRSLVRQCRAVGVACFVKQLGSRPIETLKIPAGMSAIEAGANVMTLSYAGMVSQPSRWLRDRKGGDMAEWPEDLRVREWPR